MDQSINYTYFDDEEELDPWSDEVDDFIHDDDFVELSNEVYDDAELERRRLAYSDLRKHDKIFNNTYNLGYDYTEEDDDTTGSSRINGREIKLDSACAEFDLTSPDRYSDHVDLSIIQNDLNNFINNNKEILEILGNEPEKKKFTKLELNQLFELIVTGLNANSQINVFISPIYVLDAISSAINMEYKKIFDMLNYENKELLLLELNSKYGVLDNMYKNFKMF